MSRVSPFLVGLLFGIGLCLSGMTNPSKVLAFLDLGGAWDPSLAFVMAGAIAIAFVAFRIAAAARGEPLGRAVPLADRKSDRCAPYWRIAPLRRRLGARGPVPRPGDRRPRLSRQTRGALRPRHGRRHGSLFGPRGGSLDARRRGRARRMTSSPAATLFQSVLAPHRGRPTARAISSRLQPT